MFRRAAFLLLIHAPVFLVTPAAQAQSLFIAQGERALEGSVAWSVGPFSNGVETSVSGSLDGRWDVGFAFNRFAADLGGEDDTTFIEWSPFARYFLFKESDDGAPVSFAAHAALFQQHYETGDEGWYVLGGGQLFKRLGMSDLLALYPFVGFSLVAESYSFGGASADRSISLARQFGVSALLTLGADAWVRLTAEEQAFRRETYRAARVAYVRRF